MARVCPGLKTRTRCCCWSVLLLEVFFLLLSLRGVALSGLAFGGSVRGAERESCDWSHCCPPLDLVLVLDAGHGCLDSCGVKAEEEVAPDGKTMTVRRMRSRAGSRWGTNIWYWFLFEKRIDLSTSLCLRGEEDAFTRGAGQINQRGRGWRGAWVPGVTVQVA